MNRWVVYGGIVIGALMCNAFTGSMLVYIGLTADTGYVQLLGLLFGPSIVISTLALLIAPESWKRVMVFFLLANIVSIQTIGSLMLGA